MTSPPRWDSDRETYSDPKTGAPLIMWAEALDRVPTGDDAQPAYVARLGRIDARGITHGTKNANAPSATSPST